MNGGSNGTEAASAGGGVLSKAGILSKAGTVPASSGEQKPAGAGLLAKAGDAGGGEDAKSAETGGVKRSASGDAAEHSDDGGDSGGIAAKRRKLGHPDPDTIKMFAGQIPKRMEEAEVRKVFEEFGPVYELSILKDRATGQSRGCGFVTFFTRKAALQAQNKLHNVRTLPGMHHPMQLKPADVENRSERKLFVGMIGKQADDEAVWTLFSKYGPIEECTILRDAKKMSKGCAFVTFMSRQHAMTAIRALHHSRTMEGCSAPLVVKLADNQREQNAGRGNFGGPSGPPPLGGSNRKPLGNFNNSGNNNSGGWANRQPMGPPPPMQQQQQPPPNTMNQMNQMSQSPQAMALLQQLSNAASALSALAGQGGMFGGQQGGQQNNPAGALAMMMQAAGMNRPQGAQQFQPPPANNAPNFNNGGGGGGMSVPAAAPVAAPGQTAEGPEGCNLFVYHLPAECSDADLASMFSPFGNVISAAVVVDKETGQSRGFGSVSYDNAASAQAAVQGMDNFQIGEKQLKVLPKRSFGQPAAQAN